MTDQATLDALADALRDVQTAGIAICQERRIAACALLASAEEKLTWVIQRLVHSGVQRGDT